MYCCVPYGFENKHNYPIQTPQFCQFCAFRRIATILLTPQAVSVIVRTGFRGAATAVGKLLRERQELKRTIPPLPGAYQGRDRSSPAVRIQYER
jgi:hypothetical protein